MSKIHIGIDIGSKGGIVLFKDNILEMLCSFPLTSSKPDIAQFSIILSEWIGSQDSVHVVIEDLHSIFGAGAKSNFQFGWINGAIEGCLTTLLIPYTKVSPRKWQKEIWEGIRPVEILVKGKTNKDGSPKYKVDTKATSLLAAKRLFPKESFLASERSKVPHDGIVDSALLAEYCRRHF